MRTRLSVMAGALAGVLSTAFLIPSPAQAASEPTSGHQRRALIVGVTDYSGRTASTAAGAADADDFERVLLDNGFSAGNIVKLTEGRATAANIRTGLQWLADQSTDNTFSVFHYSGHVKQMSGDRDRDGEKVDEFLWPYDNKFIADGELGNRMRSMRGLTWIDIAGCEGAGFDDGISGPSRLFTASSRETEKSYEYPAWNNSVFTGLEIDQAFLQGKGDRNGNGKVSIQEAFALAYEQAPKITAKQKKGPQNPQSAGGSGAEWYLDGPPAPPARPAGEGRQPEPEPKCLLCL